MITRICARVKTWFLWFLVSHPILEILIFRDAIFEAIAGIIGEPFFYLKWTLQTPKSR
jgi:hypothetical protein